MLSSSDEDISTTRRTGRLDLRAVMPGFFTIALRQCQTFETNPKRI